VKGTLSVSNRVCACNGKVNSWLGVELILPRAYGCSERRGVISNTVPYS